LRPRPARGTFPAAVTASHAAPAAPAGPGRPSLRALAGHPAVHALLVAAAAVLVYANTLGAPFVLDDWSTLNVPAARDLEGFLATFLWTSSRSLVDLTFVLGRALHGPEPAGYHAVNGLLHAVAALLVWRLAALLLAPPVGGAPAPPEAHAGARGPALAAGLLFAVHPLQTSAVTYVAQRYAVLATLLYVAAVVLWLEARGRAGGARRGFLAAALACTLLAMRSKEIAVTLPVLLVLVEVVRPDGPLRARLPVLAPFLASLAIVPASFLAAVGSLDAVRASDTFAAQVLHTTPPTRLEYLLTQLRVVPGYLRLLILPVGQVFDADVALERTLTPEVAVAGLLLAALLGAGIALAVRGRRDGSATAVAGLGVLWSLVTISVESSVFPIDDLRFEHRVYLPLVGFALAVAAALALARDRLRGAGPWPRRALGAAVAAWVLALGVAAHLRNEVWGDAVRFWEDDVAKAPGKARPRVNLGVALLQADRPEEAVRAFESALRLAPDDALARYNLAGLYARLGFVAPAIHHYEELLRRTPGSPATRTTLALLHLRQGRPARAEELLRSALAADPGYAPARQALEQLLRERAGR
jgi:tetratricopeptide (TPR) repeat protein